MAKRKATNTTRRTKAAGKKKTPVKAAAKKTPTRAAGNKRVAPKPRALRAKSTTNKSSKTSKPSTHRTAAGPSGTNSPPTKVTFQWGNEQIEIVDPDRAVPKTKLTKRQLRGFHESLLSKRRELVGDMENLANEAMHTSRSESSGDLSTMPIHMADLGSDNWEQEFTLGLIESERSLVHEIDDALDRVAKRTYGVCLATHRPIDGARLRAKPWARYCIEYARLRELGRVP